MWGSTVVPILHRSPHLSLQHRVKTFLWKEKTVYSWAKTCHKAFFIHCYRAQIAAPHLRVTPLELRWPFQRLSFCSLKSITIKCTHENKHCMAFLQHTCKGVGTWALSNCQIENTNKMSVDRLELKQGFFVKLVR